MQSSSASWQFWQENLETISREGISAHQLRCLRTAVERASHAPFYSDRFKRDSVKPQDIHSLEDIAQIPFTIKDDLRRAHPFGMLAVPIDDVVRIHSSSGTTGRGTAVFHTLGDTGRWSDLRKDGLDVMTVKVELQRGDCLEGGESLIALQRRIREELKREMLVTP